MAALLAFFGFIRAPAIGWTAAPQIALGYVLLVACCLAFGHPQRSQTTA